MADHQQAASGTQPRQQHFIPVRQGAPLAVAQALAGGQILVDQRRVLRIEARMARIVPIQRRRRIVIAAPPAPRDLLAPGGKNLLLVQPLQGAVMTLVQAPGLEQGDLRRTHRRQQHFGGLARTQQDRDMDLVEAIARSGQALSRLRSFGQSHLGEGNIGPAGETVGQVPLTVAVAQQHHPWRRRVHSGASVSTSLRWWRSAHVSRCQPWPSKWNQLSAQLGILKSRGVSRGRPVARR